MSAPDFVFYLSIAGSLASLVALVTIWPLVIRRIGPVFSNKTFVVVGARGVGKTSLLKVMRGYLPDPVHIRTLGYLDVKNVRLDLGGPDVDVFQARIVRELGGESSANLGATLCEINASGIIIVADQGMPEEEAQVILDVVSGIIDYYRLMPIDKIKLKAILIVLNKYDLSENDRVVDVISRFKDRYDKLFVFFEERHSNIHVNICCGSLTQAQFFSPVQDGMRFLVRGTRS